jgi:hypothetical protein
MRASIMAPILAPLTAIPDAPGLRSLPPPANRCSAA